jgi:hypothetical protein
MTMRQGSLGLGLVVVTIPQNTGFLFSFGQSFAKPVHAI